MEAGLVRSGGCGGFLNPPTHPEHDWHVETDLNRSPRNRGSMSLSYAVKCEWLDETTRASAQRRLDSWVRPALNSPEVVGWIRQVLGYFKWCYKGDGETPWNADKLRILPAADPLLNADIHAGVNFIRKYYPEFVPTADDFAAARWGRKAVQTA